MRPTKLFYMIMIASLSCMGNVSSAAVQDMGNAGGVNKISSNSTATGTHQAPRSKSGTINPDTDDSLLNDALSPSNFDISSYDNHSSNAASYAREVRHENHYDVDRIKRKIKEGHFYPVKEVVTFPRKEDENNNQSSGNTEDQQSNQDDYLVKHDAPYHPREDNTYTPITSPVPEPETYAMVLAGLGLIALTIRRRKQAP